MEVRPESVSWRAASTGGGKAGGVFPDVERGAQREAQRHPGEAEVARQPDNRARFTQAKMLLVEDHAGLRADGRADPVEVIELDDELVREPAAFAEQDEDPCPFGNRARWRGFSSRPVEHAPIARIGKV